MHLKLLSLLLVAMLALSACSKKQSEAYTAYYPDCHQPIEEMESGKHNNTAGPSRNNSGGGGLFSAITGLAAGIIYTAGRIVAGTGVILDTATGQNSGSTGQVVESDNALLAKYYNQIEGDITGLNLEQAAGTVALECYQKKLTEAESQRTAGTIDEKGFEDRKKEIEFGIRDAKKLIGKKYAPEEP